MISKKNSLYFLIITITLISLFFLFCTKKKPSEPSSPNYQTLYNVDVFFQDEQGNVIKWSIEIKLNTTSDDLLVITDVRDIGDNKVGTSHSKISQQVVTTIEDHPFQIPGVTIITLGDISYKVNVIDMGENYRVEVTRLDTAEMFYFDVDKNDIPSAGSLAKISKGTKTLEYSEFGSSLSSATSLLCVGRGQLVSAVSSCKAEAIASCSPNAVDEAYLEISYSLEGGCEYDCIYTCKQHNQGGTN